MEIINRQAQKVVVVAYRRWSFTRGSNCKALTGKILVFCIGGRLQELVVHRGSTVSRSLEQIIPGIKGTEKWATKIAWENRRHLATLPLVSPSNDVWETNAEIPYWSLVTTQIWAVTRHQYGISAHVSQTSFGGETNGSDAKCQLFSQTAVATKNVQLVLQQCCKTSWIAMLRVVLPMFRPVNNLIVAKQVWCGW